MNAASLVDAVKRAGGVLSLDGDGICFRLPENASYLLQELSQWKAEVIEVLRTLGGRVAAFPHCPQCASYALYRRNNGGAYECQTCGMQDISEDLARRVQ
jgi:hypothetical protein